MANETLKRRPSLPLTADDLERSLRFHEGLGFVIVRATDRDGFEIVVCNRA